MLPSYPVVNVPHRHIGHWQEGRDLRLAQSGGKESFDFPDLSLGQFVLRDGLARIPVRGPCHILFLRAEEQVIGAHTAAIGEVPTRVVTFAMMADEEVIGDRSEMQFPRDAMRADWATAAAAATNLPVPLAAKTGDPEPTAITDPHLSPEALRERSGEGSGLVAILA